MKKFSLFIIAFVLVLFQSCSKENQSSSSSTEAQAAYDNSSFGLYKGVIVGSSGTIKITVNNGDNIVRAYLVVDGTKDTLISNSSFISGQSISNATFTGKLSTFKFSVNGSGSSATITSITIQGHTNVAGIIGKQTSTQVVSCFEGTYNGQTSTGLKSTGTFNCFLVGNIIVGISRETANGYTDTVTGNITNGNISAQGTVTTGANFSGTLKDTQCSGTWVNGVYSGTWIGIKTL
jgi:hypothetical protein